MMRKNKIIAIIILLLLGAVIIRWQGNNLKNVLYAIVSPSQRFLWSKGNDLSGFFQALWFSQGLKSENDQLKQGMAGLQQKVAELKQQEQENLDLRAALGWQTEKKWQLETADILSKELNRDILTINKGQANGLEVGMAVITNQGNLAGRISQVFENFAKVMLISDTESSFNIEIQTGKNPTGIVKGRGGFQLGFEYIPKEEELKLGDMVITTTLGGIFPKGIIVGEVEKISKNDAEPYQSGTIKSYFRQTAMESLLVIVKH